MVHIIDLLYYICHIYVKNIIHFFYNYAPYLATFYFARSFLIIKNGNTCVFSHLFIPLVLISIGIQNTTCFFYDFYFSHVIFPIGNAITTCNLKILCISRVIIFTIASDTTCVLAVPANVRVIPPNSFAKYTRFFYDFCFSLVKETQITKPGYPYRADNICPSVR